MITSKFWRRETIALDFGPNDLDGGELTHSYSVENGEVKMTKQEIIAGDQRVGFDPVERDTVYNRVAAV